MRLGPTIIVILAFVMMSGMGMTSGETIIVDDDEGPWADFNGIQDAINNSVDGDVLIVYNGTYYEHLSVRKQLTIIGNGSSDTHVLGSQNRPIIFGNINHTTIQGFNISNTDQSTCGIYLNGTNCTIRDNAISRCRAQAIIIKFSNRCSVINNTLERNVEGIVLYGEQFECNSNHVVKCDRGIDIYSGTKRPSNNSNLTNNTLENNKIGMSCSGTRLVNIYNNTFMNNTRVGLSIGFCNDSIITDNTFSNNQIGLQIEDCRDDIISNCTINDNAQFGILVIGAIVESGSCYNLSFFDNIIEDNGNYGLNLSTNPSSPPVTRDCTIFHNVFLGNGGENAQGFDEGINNSWDSNIWSDYSGDDSDHDGIGDIPYEIDGEANTSDHYPLLGVYPFIPDPAISDEDIEISSDTLFYNFPYLVSVTVHNNGPVDAHNITVKIEAGTDEQSEIIDIPALSSVQLSFNFTPKKVGSMDITVRLKMPEGTSELSDTNDFARIVIQVSDSGPRLDIDESTTFYTPIVKLGDTVQIHTIVRNNYAHGFSNVVVALTDGNSTIATQIIPALSAKSEINISLLWTPAQLGNFTLYLLIDPSDDTYPYQATSHVTVSIEVVEPPAKDEDESLNDSNNTLIAIAAFTGIVFAVAIHFRLTKF